MKANQVKNEEKQICVESRGRREFGALEEVKGLQTGCAFTGSRRDSDVEWKSTGAGWCRG